MRPSGRISQDIQYNSLRWIDKTALTQTELVESFFKGLTFEDRQEIAEYSTEFSKRGHLTLTVKFADKESSVFNVLTKKG
jgi:hypothetical protein